MASTVMHYTPALNVTGKAKGAIAKATFVAIAGEIIDRAPQVKTADAGAHPFGVAAFDAADGEAVTIYRVGIYELAVNGAIAVGDPIAVAANGKATKAAEGAAVVGVAVSKAADGVVTVALN